MKRDDLILALAAYKVQRTTAPPMPAPGQASIEAMGRRARVIADFEAGRAVYDVKVEGELVGQHVAGGTAELVIEGVLDVDLEITAARAVATLARGMGEQVIGEAKRLEAEAAQITANPQG